MAWHDNDEQARLWNALMRYANVYPEVFSHIPEGSYVLLIPEHDLLDEHEGVVRFLMRSNPEMIRQVAYIYLELADYYLPGTRKHLPSITGVSVALSLDGRSRGSTPV